MEWDVLRKGIEDIFHKKSEKLGIRANLELHFTDYAPVEGEYVYGEAFPDENKVWLEVVALDASTTEIMEHICHELIHMKCPDLSHDSNKFKQMVRQCMNA